MQICQLTIPNKTLFTLTQTFRYLNCCCNFFLYSATSSLFRRELREIFQCINSKDVKYRTRTLSSPPPVRNNESTKRKNLLSATATTEIPDESFNLIDSTNGHVVSFKT
jgi:hypothetical protein